MTPDDHLYSVRTEFTHVLLWSINRDNQRPQIVVSRVENGSIMLGLIRSCGKFESVKVMVSSGVVGWIDITDSVSLIRVE